MPRKVRHQYWPVMQPRAIEWVRIGGKRKRWDEQFESSGWTIHNKCEWNFLFDIPFVVLTILFSKCVLHSMKRFPSVQPTLLFFIALCVVRLIFGLSSAWLSFNVIWFSLFHLLYSCARAYWNIPMHKPVNIECEFLCCALFFTSGWFDGYRYSLSCVTVMLSIDKDDRSNYNTKYGNIIYICSMSVAISLLPFLCRSILIRNVFFQAFIANDCYLRNFTGYLIFCRHFCSLHQFQRQPHRIPFTYGFIWWSKYFGFQSRTETEWNQCERQAT